MRKKPPQKKTNNKEESETKVEMKLDIFQVVILNVKFYSVQV